MHELGIMSEVLKSAIRVCEKNGGSRVTKVTMRIGVMSGVVPYFARSMFQTICKGTICEDCKVSIIEEPAVFACTKCGEKTTYKDLAPEYVCSSCGSPQLKLLSGHDFKIDNIAII